MALGWARRPAASSPARARAGAVLRLMRARSLRGTPAIARSPPAAAPPQGPRAGGSGDGAPGGGSGDGRPSSAPETCPVAGGAGAGDAGDAG